MFGLTDDGGCCAKPAKTTYATDNTWDPDGNPDGKR